MTVEDIYNLLVAEVFDLCKEIRFRHHPKPTLTVQTLDRFRIKWTKGLHDLSAHQSTGEDRWFLVVQNPSGLPHAKSGLTPKNSHRAEVDPRNAASVIRYWQNNELEQQQTIGF